MTMYATLTDEIRTLIKEVTPWIIGAQGADKDFAPIFKDNTPLDIKEKNKRLSELCRN